MEISGAASELGLGRPAATARDRSDPGAGARDPRLLADAEALPEGDPLRRAARAVCELFDAVTRGPLVPGALAALDGSLPTPLWRPGSS